jgi:hypothetical protein
MSPLPRFRKTLLLIALLVALFGFHRLMIKEYIGLDLTGDLLTQLQALGIGLLSDLWIATVLALPYFFTASRIYFNTIFAFIAISLATQVPYVEFFRTSMRWIHLSYLVDFEFLRSSGSFLGRPRFWLSLLFALAIFVPVSSKIADTSTGDQPRANSIKAHTFGYFLALLALGIGANALSQKWTRNFNFSVKLTQNLVVQLVLDGIETTKIGRSIKFDETDLKTLSDAHARVSIQSPSPAQGVPVQQPSAQQPPAQLLRNAALPAENPATLDFITQKLKKNFTENILKSQNRYFFVVILESMRAAESRLLTPGTRGYTENLDKLSAQGIAFAAGYSSSVVSRSGAESSVCNFISTIALNTMRDTPIEKAKCARELFQAQLESQGITSTYSWLHGGYHGFDNQGLFYKTAGFEIPFDILRLPRDLPRTDWGLSDKALFALSNDWLKKKDQESKAGLHFSTLVTVSNHTAWDLPSDADPALTEFQKQSTARHFATVKYSDAAVGQWVAQLKADGLWEKSVVVFVGDHGMQDPADGVGPIPGFGHGSASDLVTADHLTRVYFSMSGGLVESAVSACRGQKLCDSSVHLKHPVSQIDILPTLAQLLPQADTQPWFGVSLLSARRLWPVFADLGDFYFVPQAQRPIVSKQALHAGSEVGEIAPEWSEFRAYLNVYSTLVRQGKLRDSLYGGIR